MAFQKKGPEILAPVIIIEGHNSKSIMILLHQSSVKCCNQMCISFYKSTARILIVRSAEGACSWEIPGLNIWRPVHNILYIGHMCVITADIQFGD